MKKNTIPLTTAFIVAVAIHILVLTLSNDKNTLDQKYLTPQFEITLLPEANPEINNTKSSELNERVSSQQQLITPSDTFLERSLSHSDNVTIPNTISFTEQEMLTKHLKKDSLVLEKADLLNLSNLDLSPEKSTETPEKIFSEVLRNKIAESTSAQENYLKGQMKEEEYLVTRGVDGSRYVNINGVCWRVPDMGSNELWGIVLAGCSGQSKTFLFELNIAPSVFLGNDSPFFIGK